MKYFQNIKILIGLCLLSLFVNCHSLYTSDLKPTGKIITQLPQLEPRMNISGLENVFGVSQSTTNGFGTATILLGEIPFVITSSNTSTYRAPRIQDISVIFDREVKGDLCDISKDIYVKFTKNI